MSNENIQRPLSQHPEIAEQISWLQDNWKPAGQVTKLPTQLISSIDQFGRRQENRNRRGVKSTCISNVLRMLGHVKSGVKRQVDGDKKLAHDAKRFLKSLQHHNSLDQTMLSARQFAGTVQKVGKSLARKKAVCAPTEFDCGFQEGLGKVLLHRIVSVDELKTIGKKLHLCVAKDDQEGRRYHRGLRNGETEYWSIETNSEPFLLLSVDVEDERQLDELGGHNKRADIGEPDYDWTQHLSAEVLRRVQHFLEIDASEDEYFSCIGAFISLHSHEGLRDYLDIKIGRHNHRVWWFGNELIIASSGESNDSDLPPSTVRWSRFIKVDNRLASYRRARRIALPSTHSSNHEWQVAADHHGAMSLGELIGLMERSAELCHLFRGGVS